MLVQMASQPGSSILASGSRPQRHAVSDVKDGGALQAGAGAAITDASAVAPVTAQFFLSVDLSADVLTVANSDEEAVEAAIAGAAAAGAAAAEAAWVEAIAAASETTAAAACLDAGGWAAAAACWEAQSS